MKNNSSKKYKWSLEIKCSIKTKCLVIQEPKDKNNNLKFQMRSQGSFKLIVKSITSHWLYKNVLSPFLNQINNIFRAAHTPGMGFSVYSYTRGTLCYIPTPTNTTPQDYTPSQNNYVTQGRQGIPQNIPLTFQY